MYLRSTAPHNHKFGYAACSRIIQHCTREIKTVEAKNDLDLTSSMALCALNFGAKMEHRRIPGARVSPQRLPMRVAR
jgi:hypothetical protein